jgi:glycerol-3-phosphate dehydrogenase
LENFSSKNRQAIINQMSSASFDVIVIGGGITGAGIALDASVRGLKVALVEMQDFASGTSSRSTKLIHGGLRYLKQLEFKLVAEVGKERAIVYQNAPHLTKPEHLLLPIVKGGSLNMFTGRLGMTIYELLAGVKKAEWHQVLTKEKAIVAEPLLKRDGLLGGILFYEYRTDDARLTMEVMKEAVDRGTVALNYLKAVKFNYDNNKISGVQVQDQLTKETVDLKAKYIVNATGPWVDEVDDIDKNQTQHKLLITKGIHIVVDGNKFPLKQSSYFDTADKRMIFVIPREGKVYIGTTDTFYKEDIVNPQPTKEDIDYLLKCVNDLFPSVKLSTSDVESGWVGLRPLIQKPGKGPSEISRKDELFISNSGLITIAGGKLTGYRKMAQHVIDLIAKKIKQTEGKNIPDCTTEKVPLSGGKVGGAILFNDFAKLKVVRFVQLGLSGIEAQILINRFGSNIDKVLAKYEMLKTEDSPLPLILRAQLHYCIEEEMCVTPSDFFVRRIGAMYFDYSTVKTWESELLKYMKATFGWNEQLTNQFEKELKDSKFGT